MGGGVTKPKKEKPEGAPPEIEEYLQRVFHQSDADASGELDPAEFFTMLKTLDLNLSDDDIEQLRLKADVDGNGMISLAEVIPAAAGMVSEVYHKHHENTDADWCELPAGAEGAEGAEESKYWYDKRTMESQWDAPDLAPPDIDAWMKHVFAEAGSGGASLSPDQLVELLHAQLSLTDDAVAAIRASADANADGQVDYDEFVAAAHQALQAAYATHETDDPDVCTLQSAEGHPFCFNKRTFEAHWLSPDVPSITDQISLAFSTADADGSGELSADEIWTAFKQLNFDLSDADIEQLKTRADVDNDGSVAWHEFVPVAAELLASLDLENDWHQLVSADGTPFWANARTGETRWILEGEEGLAAPQGPSVVDAINGIVGALDEEASGSLAAAVFWPAVQGALRLSDEELAAVTTAGETLEVAPTLLAVVEGLRSAEASEASEVTLAYADGTEYVYNKQTGEAWWPS